MARANRFIEKDIARIIGPAIWDGITFRIKRANEIESVINRFVVVRFIRISPASRRAKERVDV